MMSEGSGSEYRSGPKYMSKADMEKKLPKRFYKDVTVVREDDVFQIQLDGRSVKTPAKDLLVLTSEPLAQAIAEEWAAQEDQIDPGLMVLTKLANTALDLVRVRRDGVIEEITNYLGSDLLCYRSENPQELHQRQCQLWDPILETLENKLDISLKTASGIMHVEQPDNSISNARSHLQDYDHYALSALHTMTTLSGSAALVLSHASGFFDLEKIWEAAHVDEDWQIKQWGEDQEASDRRDARFKEMKQASQFFALSRSTP